VIIDNTTFQDNEADQIDLDYTNTYISNSRFINTKVGDNNGDGLDISGTKAIVKRSSFNGFDDKGISVGEGSHLLVLESTLQENNIGVAVKDKSKLYLVDVALNLNKNDVAAYMKKKIFGGGKVFFQGNIGLNNGMKIILDEKSSIYQFRSLNYTDEKSPEKILQSISNIFENIGLVEKKLLKLTPNFIYEASRE